MEDCPKDQSSALASGGKSSAKLLRYPLRSAVKSKEEKQSEADPSNSSASRRGRPASNVSKSVNVLDLSGKDKPAKPPRRLSIPSKSSASPVPKGIGNITPISEVRAKRSTNHQGKSETPLSDVSKSSNRRNFSPLPSASLSSASYWLTQIKRSESAAKHSISLGFFKLALEAGCEPLQRMTDELKSYACRHDLIQLGEPVKKLFEIYNISENCEQLQVSDALFRMPDEGIQSSDSDVHSHSIVSAHSLKPKALNIGATETYPFKEPVEIAQKGLKPKTVNANSIESSPVTGLVKETAWKSNSVTKIRASMKKNSASIRSASGAVGCNTQKRNQKTNKQGSYKDQVEKQETKSALEEGLCPVNSTPTEVAIQENKENMDAQMEETGLMDVPTSVQLQAC